MRDGPKPGRERKRLVDKRIGSGAVAGKVGKLQFLVWAALISLLFGLETCRLSSHLLTERCRTEWHSFRVPATEPEKLFAHTYPDRGSDAFGTGGIGCGKVRKVVFKKNC